jgi:WD40 repeat protein
MPSPKTVRATWKACPLPKMKEYVNSVAISGDGSKVAAGKYFHNYGPDLGHILAAAQKKKVGIFVWDGSGKPLWDHIFESTEGIYWVALSRDGKWAASGGASGGLGFLFAYDAAKGKRTLSYFPPSRTNMVAFSSDGSTLVAGADQTYVFLGNGASWGAPQTLACPDPGAGDYVVAVAISADGQSIVLGTFKGYVVLAQNNQGSFVTKGTWQLPQGGEIHWIALASGGSGFAAAASGSNLYFFNTQTFPTTQKPAWSASLAGCISGRSVAVSDDGSLVSAVANLGSLKAPGKTKNDGRAFLFANKGTSGQQLWMRPIHCSPNSTSMDSQGQYVTVADGYPDGTPGHFHLFTADDTLKWIFETANMSWPMQISADASGIMAGSDSGFVFYFDVD